MTKDLVPISKRPLIICPMKVEADYLRKALRDPGKFEIVISGIGRKNLENTLQGIDIYNRWVVLAGVAGALRAEAIPGAAYWIDCVVNEEGRTWVPVEKYQPSLSVLGADRVIEDFDQKVEAALKSGAFLVDMESHAFAQGMYMKFHKRWAILRGVSDAVEQSFPKEVVDWLTPHGEIRWFRAFWGLFAKKHLRADVASLLGNTEQAMANVARILEEYF